MKSNEERKSAIGFLKVGLTISTNGFDEGRRMPASPGVVSNDTLALQVGSRKIPLSPSQAFGLAQDLIRHATRRMIIDEASRAQVLDTMRSAETE